MKVTAILPDDLIIEVQKYTEGKNITDSLQKALSEWVKLAKVKKLNEKLRKQPLHFSNEFNALLQGLITLFRFPLGKTNSQLPTA